MMLKDPSSTYRHFNTVDLLARGTFPAMIAHTALAALAGDYGHGDIVASHRHEEGQLVYAINGVMLVSVVGTTWVVPSGHALWVPAGRSTRSA